MRRVGNGLTQEGFSGSFLARNDPDREFDRKYSSDNHTNRNVLVHTTCCIHTKLAAFSCVSFSGPRRERVDVVLLDGCDLRSDPFSAEEEQRMYII